MNSRKAGLFGSITVSLVLVALVLLPTPIVMGSVSSLVTTKLGNPPTYLLGEKVEFQGEIAATIDDANVATVLLDIKGPQPLQMLLPLQPCLDEDNDVVFCDLTGELPKNASNQPLGRLWVKVEFGTGEGYGYQDVVKIEYLVQYWPPIFRFPPPPPAANELPNLTQSHAIPGATGGVTVLSITDTDITVLGSVPSQAEILGLAFDPLRTGIPHPYLFVLVDGAENGNDTVLQLGWPDLGIENIIDTEVTNAQGVATNVGSGNVWVVTEGPTGKQLRRVNNDGKPQCRRASGHQPSVHGQPAGARYYRHDWRRGDSRCRV